MDLIEQINTHKYLYLDKLVEENDLELELWINEARVQGNKSESPEAASEFGAIATDEFCKRYKLTVKGYIVYSVVNESWAQNNENEEFTGKLFRRYTKSNFLDYAVSSIMVKTAEEIAAEKTKHFQIVCLNHVIDVICFDGILIDELVS